jgi:hypothetical protein
VIYFLRPISFIGPAMLPRIPFVIALAAFRYPPIQGYPFSSHRPC